MPTKTRSLKLPVGRKGTNQKNDVQIIQELLNEARTKYASFKSAVNELDANGVYGPATEAAIAAFQTHVLRWNGPGVDATVEPNKSTWKALNGNVASLAKVKRLVVPRPAKVAGYGAFKQGDYAGVKLGSGNSDIKHKGCALCTLTMAATVIGSPTKHWKKALQPADLTPPIVNDVLTIARAFGSKPGQLSWIVMPKAAEALGMSYAEFGGKDSPNIRADHVSFIRMNLHAGYPVAAEVDYKSSGVGDHWILIVKGSGSEFDAIDPATGNLVRLTSAPASAQWGPVVTRKENIPNGLLFGWGRGGSKADGKYKDQQQYVVVRFALLAPAAAG